MTLKAASSEGASIIPMASPTTVLPERPVALEVDGVWKVYGATPSSFAAIDPDRRVPEEFARRGMVAAVRDARFAIGRGETFVIMGLSGSGKSTMVRCLTRLVEPTAGAIRLDGEDLLTAGDRRLTEIRRKHFGMVFQHFALLPNRTVLGNILFPLEVQRTPRAVAEKRARDLIALVGLEGRENRFPSELSGGQQQRIGIARSLATDPALWFLDEPFSALDPLIRNDLQDELLRLQKTLAKTIVFITHDLNEAIRIADRIAIMENGQIVQIGTAEDLVTFPADDYVRRFVAKVPPAKVVRVGSLMESAEGARVEGPVVARSDTIEAIGPVLVAAGPKLPVTDTDGTLVGVLDRQKALRVLARAR